MLGCDVQYVRDSTEDEACALADCDRVGVAATVGGIDHECLGRLRSSLVGGAVLQIFCERLAVQELCQFLVCRVRLERVHLLPDLTRSQPIHSIPLNKLAKHYDLSVLNQRQKPLALVRLRLTLEKFRAPKASDDAISYGADLLHV